jgi:hypothetical protein
VESQIGEKMRLPVAGRLILPIFILAAWSGANLSAQGFGLPGLHKKVVLDRKLPSIGHMEGKRFKVVVTGTGAGEKVAPDLKSTIEILLVHNDPQLQLDDARPDTIIVCRIISFDEQVPKAAPAVAKKGELMPTVRASGVLTVNFQAKAARSSRPLAADTVTAKFDQEYTAAGAEKGIMHSMTSTMSHITKGSSAEDKPPTEVELRDKLIQDAAAQAVSHFVTTTEQVEVLIAHGKGLDAAANMEAAKLWPQAIDQLIKMTPFPKPEDDSYRLYDLGVANEALGYQAERPGEGLHYLETAKDFYSKAIEEKPLEKNFLLPEARIETAIAHYKMLTEAPPPAPAVEAAAKSDSPHADAGDDELTNTDVASMVSSGLKDDNIIQAIQFAKSIHFDLTQRGQAALLRNKVSPQIIAAMKARARHK